MWSVLALSLVPSMAFAVTRCPVADVSFELATGFVYTAPDAILDTNPGVFHLSECLGKCAAEPQCQSINYETGLCVLFRSSAETNPGALTTSQFPVFTMYASKICLKGAARKCGDSTFESQKTWSFDKVSQHRLDGFVRLKRPVRDKSQCLELCFNEDRFICRSVNYNRADGMCEISDMDRHTTSSISALTEASDVDYYENNCLEFDKDKPNPELSCHFKPYTGRLLKTVDSVHQGVSSPKECQDLCVNANFRCYSFDYGDTGPDVCRLSHQTAVTLASVEEPYLKAEIATTYERGACYNVTIDCQKSYMVAHVRTNRVFSGRMYGRTRPNSCVVDVERSLDFQLKLPYNDIGCDVEVSPEGRFSSEVVIQHHDTIVTSSDVGLRVRCNYNLTDKTVTHTSDLQVDGEQTAQMETSEVEAPNVTMAITDRSGGSISSAKVGDELAIHFEVEDLNSPYEIFVRDLVASDGVDTSEILLIDDMGCPTDYSIMAELQKFKGGSSSSHSIRANFDAFKFPTSNVVQFRALVTPCIPRCDPVRCDVTDYKGDAKTLSSYGKRRRKREVSDTKGQVKVASVIFINDKFKGHDQTSQREREGFTSSLDWAAEMACELEGRQRAKSNGIFDEVTLIVAATSFVIIQCILIGVWVSVIRLTKRRRSIKRHHLSPSSQLLHQLPRLPPPSTAAANESCRSLDHVHSFHRKTAARATVGQMPTFGNRWCYAQRSITRGSSRNKAKDEQLYNSIESNGSTRSTSSSFSVESYPKSQPPSLALMKGENKSLSTKYGH